MDIHDLLAKCEGFDWDDGNTSKNWDKHRVSDVECEQLYFNLPLVVASDLRHSEHEKRFYALGQTDAGRRLFIAFAIRENHVRVISAREMTLKESKVYKNAKSED